MYRLTDKMLQNLDKDLRKFHELFQGGRCQAWQLEELIARAIRSDFAKTEKVLWKGNGHDIGCDILINDTIEMQIKSGVVDKNFLTISGHRLGRFEGNLQSITNFLNGNSYLLVAVPYFKRDDDRGRSHIYQLLYLNTNILGLQDATKWTRKNKRFFAVNEHGVELNIYPSMSWQVWWKIPIENLPEENKTRLIEIN